jgi:hypothetical protein
MSNPMTHLSSVSEQTVTSAGGDPVAARNPRRTRCRWWRVGAGLTTLGLIDLVGLLSVVVRGRAAASALMTALLIIVGLGLLIGGFLTMVVAADPFEDEPPRLFDF